MVADTVAQPAKLLGLIGRAQSFKALNSSGRFDDMLDSIKASFRLLKSYSAGDYREVSKESLGLIVASLVYLVMPVDVLPDFLFALGFVDDAAILAWTLKSVSEDIDRFRRWESEQGVIIDGEYESSD
jgi:uncharacterized membrane protein YkvA (DUF1232 family)